VVSARSIATSMGASRFVEIAFFPFVLAWTAASIARSRTAGVTVRVLVVGAPFPRRRVEFIATLRIP
jgi:hypothetical protein